MSLEVAGVKKAVNLSWDVEQVGGDLCRIIARNQATGGISNTNWSKDDGYGVLTYPLDYEGVTDVLIEGNGGGTESGTVKITAKGAEISEGNGGEEIVPPDPEPEPGPGDPIPSHPIWDESAPHPDQGLPGAQPHPDHELPGDQPHVDPR
jgi:hypothetical protein